VAESHSVLHKAQISLSHSLESLFEAWIFKIIFNNGFLCRSIKNRAFPDFSRSNLNYRNSTDAPMQARHWLYPYLLWGCRGMLTAGERDDILYDLGSGDGRVVIAAAQQFGSRGVGIDIQSASGKPTENAQIAGWAIACSFANRLVWEWLQRGDCYHPLYLLPIQASGYDLSFPPAATGCDCGVPWL